MTHFVPTAPTGLSRRGFTAWMASAAAVGVVPALRPSAADAAEAQLTPKLRIVIPANEGGGWDQTGRALGAAMIASGAVGDISYENIGGKGGTIGLAKYVEKYDTDPDTLLMSGMVMVGAVALQKPAITMAQVAPVARLTSDYEVVAVKADSPIKTPKDLIAQLRADAAKTVIAGGSAGGVDHMYAGMLARVAGNAGALVYQPHPGGAQVVEALESGKAAAGISGYSEFSEQLANGKLRAIGVSAKRPFLGIPSVREQGVDADLANWRGVLTGKKVTAERKAVLLEAVRRATQADVWQKTIKRNNWDPYWMAGKDFESFLDLIRRWPGPSSICSSSRPEAGSPPGFAHFVSLRQPPSGGDTCGPAKPVPRCLRPWAARSGKKLRHLPPRLRRQRERPPVQLLPHPSPFQRQLQPRRAQRAAQVRAALAPVEAGTGEAAARAAHLVDLHAQALQRDRTIGREFVGAALQSAEPALRMQPVVQRDAGRARHVVVAGAGAAQAARRAGPELGRRWRAWGAGHHHQAFERGSDVVVGEAEVAVLALHQHVDQPLFLQARQVCTGGGGCHLGDGGELGGGACVAVHQAAQHAGARRLGDGAGQAGELEVGG